MTKILYIIVESIIKLEKGNKAEIKQKMDEYKQFRIEKQPIEYPSAGSTFKRGTDFITAKLIDDAGLKGFTIGGAQVSEKHAGFIINKNNAKAKKTYMYVISDFCISVVFCFFLNEDSKILHFSQKKVPRH